MDNMELQRRMKEMELYSGALDGTLGPLSMQGIAALLNFGRVKAPRSWPNARRVLAAKQLICRMDGIEVGAVDGLYGPQTQFAFEVYAERLGGKPARLPDRDRGQDETLITADAAQAWPRQAEVERFFGPVGANQVLLDLPYPLRIAWDQTKTVRRISVHSEVRDSAGRCFERIAETYDAQARRELGLDLFGGCFNVRRMRGGQRWSMHSWGIAIDFDPSRNGLRSNSTNARLAQPDCEPFWQIWENEGWVSLGRTRDFDWMHIQAAQL